MKNGKNLNSNKKKVEILIEIATSKYPDIFHIQKQSPGGVKKALLKISQKSQENTSARGFFSCRCSSLQPY